MRMWMIKPESLCRKHLLGEHVELHMLIESINRGRSLQGFLDKRLIEPQNIFERHDILVSEMNKRGYHHKSELELLNNFDFNNLSLHCEIYKHSVDRNRSVRDLCERCEECRKRIKKDQK